MALTKEQEEWLAATADKGIVEDADMALRNAQIVLDLQNDAARAKRRAELEAEAAALIAAGMQALESTLVITVV